MKDNRIIGLIFIMAMKQPVGSFCMDFNTSGPERTVYLHLGIEEVGARIGIGYSGVDH